jgi:hypothetical protein
MQQATRLDAAAPAGGQTQSPTSSSVPASTDSVADQAANRPGAAVKGVKIDDKDAKGIKEFIKTHGGLTTIPYKVRSQPVCTRGVCCDLAMVLQQHPCAST